MKNENILVSVVCDVYNHEPYLRQCFDGFVMQKTNFKFEVLVHDDASTDKSAEIIIEYTNKYPDIFKPIIQKENQYSKGVSIWKTYQFPRVQGKYIAICEGDDYWISKDKLQKQIEVLQRYNCCSMVCTRTCYFSQRQMRYVSENRCLKKTGFLECKNVILKGGEYISTASICFKKEVLDKYPLYCRKCYIGDYPLQIMCAMKGKVYYIDEKMTVYRMDNVLSWCGREASAIDVYNVEKYKRKMTLLDMLYGFSQDYPQYSDFFVKRIAFSINNEITRHISKKVAKNILYFYNKYIDEFKWNWRIDLMMRLYIPQKVLGVYTKIASLLCYRKFYKK